MKQLKKKKFCISRKALELGLKHIFIFVWFQNSSEFRFKSRHIQVSYLLKQSMNFSHRATVKDKNFNQVKGREFFSP